MDRALLCLSYLSKTFFYQGIRWSNQDHDGLCVIAPEVLNSYHPSLYAPNENHVDKICLTSHCYLHVRTVIVHCFIAEELTRNRLPEIKCNLYTMYGIYNWCGKWWTCTSKYICVCKTLLEHVEWNWITMSIFLFLSKSAL